MKTHTPRIALVTCSELPQLDSDSRRLIAALAEIGLMATPAVWDDPAVDWSTFDLAVIRSCWDYVPRLAEFITWARRVPRLANAADVVAWNTDKRYLQELAVLGLPVVPTMWLEPGRTWHLPDDGEWVIKPVIGMASIDAGRYLLTSGAERELALAHIRRLHDAGRAVMVQPYLAGVDREGEIAMVYIDGRFNHAVRKGPALNGPDRGADRRFQSDGGVAITAAQPSLRQRALADRVLAAVYSRSPLLLYARVDIVPGDDGEPLVSELELTEPHLFLGYAPGSSERLASAIRARVELRMQWYMSKPAL